MAELPLLLHELLTLLAIPYSAHAVRFRPLPRSQYNLA